MSAHETRRGAREQLTLGHGDNDDGDRDDENLDEVLGLLVGGPIAVAREVDEEAVGVEERRFSELPGARATAIRQQDSPNHEGSEEDETGSGTKLGDELSEGVELELKRGVLGLSLESCVKGGRRISARRVKIKWKRAQRTHHNLAVERVLTNVGSDVRSNTLEDLGSRKEEAVDLALLGTIEILKGSLAHGVRLARGARFVAANIVTGEEETVDGENLSGLDVEDVTDDDIVDRHELLGSTADDLDVAFFLLRAVGWPRRSAIGASGRENQRPAYLSFWN